MKQVEVTILGQSYLLACPDGAQAQLASAVTSVDREMAAIRDAGKVKARERIAVLAALNIAFDRPPAGPESDAEESSAQSVAPHQGAQAPAQAAENTVDDGANAATLSPDDEALISALIARIDEALGADGRLI
jgi:cell division protein ZapA